MAKSMVKANGRNKLILTLAIAMKESISWTKRTDRECSNGKVEISIKEIIKMMREMAMEKCFGWMVLCIREFG
jgi:hypothetical protein